MDTRLSVLLVGLQARARRRWRALDRLFPLAPFCVLAGFYGGNGFATTVKHIRWLGMWEGITILGLVLLLEGLQRTLYSARLARPLSPMLWMVQCTKLGFLWGIFVDAFKVGS